MSESISANLETQSAQASVTGSAARCVPLPATNTPPRCSVSGVMVKAFATNTAIVYVGGANVAAGTGTPLAAGETLTLPIADPSRFYAVSASGTQTVSITWAGAAL